ncbi:MAG: hypothetical protein VXV96_11025 [Bdellovibrionota bacterium]|nr:hypothetical protein [Bdellovibrionota bacterium]
MKRSIKALIIFGLCTSIIAKDDYVSCNKDAPKYYLAVGNVQGLFKGEIRKKPFGVYDYSGDSPVKLKEISRDVDHACDAIKPFYVGKDFPCILIVATEKKGDYYKTCLEGKDVWILESDMKIVYDINDFFKRISKLFGFGFSGLPPQIYESINGKKIDWKKFVKKVKSKSYQYGIDGEVKEVKIVNEVVWVKILVFEEEEVLYENEEKAHFKPFIV